MKRAELLKWCKANGVKIPIGTKTHEALRLIRESGKELPKEIQEDMDRVVETAKEKERGAWSAAKGAVDGDVSVEVVGDGVEGEVPSESPVGGLVGAVLYPPSSGQGERDAVEVALPPVQPVPATVSAPLLPSKITAVEWVKNIAGADGKVVWHDGKVYDDLGEGVRRGPVADVREVAFRHLFNGLTPGRGYWLPELSEMAGFEVTDAHFAEAVMRDIAFPKSGGRWVRRPKDHGENVL